VETGEILVGEEEDLHQLLVGPGRQPEPRRLLGVRCRPAPDPVVAGLLDRSGEGGDWMGNDARWCLPDELQAADEVLSSLPLVLSLLEHPSLSEQHVPGCRLQAGGQLVVLLVEIQCPTEAGNGFAVGAARERPVGGGGLIPYGLRRDPGSRPVVGQDGGPAGEVGVGSLDPFRCPPVDVTGGVGDAEPDGRLPDEAVAEPVARLGAVVLLDHPGLD
jgi:hypothetical protein